jgi:hypothetical protein
MARSCFILIKKIMEDANYNRGEGREWVGRKTGCIAWRE